MAASRLIPLTCAIARNFAACNFFQQAQDGLGKTLKGH